MSQLVETKNVTKLTNKYDIKPVGFQYRNFEVELMKFGDKMNIFRIFEVNL